MAHTHAGEETEFIKRLREEALETDKEDVLAVLTLRFGEVPAEVAQTIAQLTDASKVERLVLVAANVPKFSKFLEELGEGAEAFRLVGEGFNPLGDA